MEREPSAVDDQTVSASRRWLDLPLRPGRFFSSPALPTDSPLIVAAAWIVGMNYALGRIEQRMIRAELGQESGAAALVSDSWLTFWVVLAIAGVVSGAFAWWVGAWWYRVRLGWSGASDPEREPARTLHRDRARAVYLLSGLVWAVPVLLWTVVDTMLFPNYAAAWADESVWDLLLIVPPIWAFVVSYRGVRAAFDVRPGRARLWFLILPITVFLLAAGVIGVLYAGLEQ